MSDWWPLPEPCHASLTALSRAAIQSKRLCNALHGRPTPSCGPPVVLSGGFDRAENPLRASPSLLFSHLERPAQTLCHVREKIPGKIFSFSIQAKPCDS